MVTNPKSYISNKILHVPMLRKLAWTICKHFLCLLNHKDTPSTSYLDYRPVLLLPCIFFRKIFFKWKPTLICLVENSVFWRIFIFPSVTRHIIRRRECQREENVCAKNSWSARVFWLLLAVAAAGDTDQILGMQQLMK